MAEYSSMKVPELKKLLAEKSLAQTGNKADLIARLQESDKAAGDKAEPTDAGKEDEISYSDDEAAGAKPTETAAQDAAAAIEPAESAAVATAAAAAATTEPAQAALLDETTEAPTAADKPAEPAPSFAMGLSSTGVDAETKKRADRAKRFGLEEDEEAKKRTERATRFGIDEKELASGLDSALPERPLKRGRGRGAHDGNRPGKRQSTDRRGGQRSRQQNGGRQGGGSVLDDPSEKLKAEKRAARFAAN